MLKGVIKALGIQGKAVYVHLICHWGIFPFSTWFFVFYYDFGIVGLWVAKIILEWSIVSMYTFIISTHSWQKSADKAKERMSKELSLKDDNYVK